MPANHEIDPVPTVRPLAVEQLASVHGGAQGWRLGLELYRDIEHMPKAGNAARAEALDYRKQVIRRLWRGR